MLRTREEFVGFLFLGDKLSGDIYSDQDLKLLEILASELAVAITNAKAYEEIEQFNITLQDRVNKATARLRVANRNLKELDKAKDEFISMASHQLRTPLTTIKGYISMMLEGDSGKVSREQKEFLDYAFEGAERMVALISDLLNVSRLSAGRFVIEKVPSDIVAVVSDEVRQLQSHAEAKQLTLKFIPPEHKLGQIMLDEGKTRQVIMNFIDNAIYYTKKGSITVSLEFDKQKVYLRVRDNGIGVPEAAKAKLFTKFFRADNAQVARPDGTGLGLYLAKRVVEDQGGTILFESTEGKGSMFGFSLPILAAPAKVVTEPKAPVRIKAKVHKVKAVKG
jgi:signal transduction histidine kinase